MKNSSKIIVWSAFVFPGAGQIIYQHKRRGMIFVFLALVCTAALFIILIKSSLMNLEHRALLGETINVSTFFKSIFFSLMVAKKYVLPPLFLVWLLSLIDAWQIGNVLDKKPAEL